MLTIINGLLATADGWQNKPVTIENGKFTNEKETNEKIDAEGCYVVPGFIDIHTHGMSGYDFMDCTEEAVMAIAHSHLLNGATTIIPTSLASTKEETLHFLEAFSAMNHKPENGADMPFVHLEGPYFAESQKGAQPEEYLRNPDPQEYEEILDKYGHIVKRWSAAPELEGTETFAKACQEKGVLLSFAHSDADYQCAAQAHEWGFNHFTHLYSCMSVVHRKNGLRHGGLVEAAYLLDNTTVELISDGMHLPPELVKLAYKNKGADHACLITDSMRAANMPEGEYVLGSLENNHRVIVKDGVAWMPGFESFAGSVSTMHSVFKTAVERCGIPLLEAVKMASETPARIMGLTTKGKIAPGYDADCLILDKDYNLKAVIKAGKAIDLKGV